MTLACAVGHRLRGENRAGAPARDVDQTALTLYGFRLII